MVHEQESIVSLAARLGDRRLDWNELDFVGWKEFCRMAPTVVGLEIGRIERLIVDSDVGGESYNALVRVRYALRQFVDGIENSDKTSVATRSKFLESALLGLSLAIDGSGDRDAETLRYVAHRLTYVNERIKLIY